MTELRIGLLGSLQVERDGEPVTAFRTDAGRALVSVLAAQRGMQRRERLATMLAAVDKSDSEALAYLRTALSRLRSTLGDKEATPPFLIVNRKEIGFIDSVQVDVHTFAALLQAVEQHPHREAAHCPSCIDKLKRAVGLYRGAFVDGLNFGGVEWEAWRRGEQARLEKAVISALETLATWQQAQLDWAAVLATARRVLEIQPWHEAAHRWAMDAQWRQGALSEALRQYQLCLDALRDALAVAPGAETMQLLNRITGSTAQQAMTTGEHPHNLPRVRTRFFGRNHQLAQLEQLLTDPDYRLVTLLGEGGIGKSRLAQEAGRLLLPGFADGVWFVPLVDVEGADGILHAIAQTLDFSFDPNRPLLSQLTRFLHSAELLLILDNFEHLVEEADVVLDLLDGTERPAILCTSRVALNFAEETVIALRGIGKDEGGRRKDEVDSSVLLFVERARRTNGRFVLTEENAAQVARIGELVAGSPLGIELAATWVRSRSVGQIVAAIEDSADFLTTRRRDVARRHRSMRAVFRSSWALLEPFEQAIFARLSVFRGGFSAEAAHAVADAELDDLETLIDQSLLQFDNERYVIHELLRQFAGAQLTEPETTRRRFLDYFGRYLRRHAVALKGREPGVAAGALAREERNLWQFWVWATERDGSLPVSHAAFLTAFYLYTGRYREGEAMVRQSAEKLGNMPVLQRERARLLAAMGRLDEAAQWVAEGVIFGRILRQTGRAGDAVAVLTAAMETDDLQMKAEALRQRAIATLMSRGDHAAALAQLQEALALCRSTGYLLEEAWTLTNMGNIQLMLREAEAAAQSHAAALALFQRADYTNGVANTLLNLALAHKEAWHLVAAEARLREALRLYERRDDARTVGDLWCMLGAVLGRQGQLQQAEQILRRALDLAERRKNSADQGNALSLLGQVAYLREQYPTARVHLQNALEHSGGNRDRLGFIQLALAETALAMDRQADAERLFLHVVEMRPAAGETHLAMEALAGLAEAQLHGGDRSAAERSAQRVVTFVASGNSLLGCERPLAIYWRLYRVLGDTEWLHEAQRQLLEQAAQFDEVSTSQRTAFLQNIPLHHAILSGGS